LLEASIDGARGVLLSVSGGSDLGLFEINEAARLVAEAAHPEANIIFGAVIDDALGDEVRVTVIAAGFDGGAPGPMKPVLNREPARAVTAPAVVEPSEPETAEEAAAEAEEPAIATKPAPKPKTIVFDDASGDDLDVPDFLK
jgi:cell division protein FtsZ